MCVTTTKGFGSGTLPVTSFDLIFCVFVAAIILALGLMARNAYKLFR